MSQTDYIKHSNQNEVFAEGPEFQVTGMNITPLVDFGEKLEADSWEIPISDHFDYLPQFKILGRHERTVRKIKSIDLSWITFLQKNHSEKIERPEIRKIIEGVHELIRNDQKFMLNSIVRDTLDESSSNDAIVTLLRSTYPVHSSLPSWKDTLDKAKEWINIRGGDFKKILVGMSE